MDQSLLRVKYCHLSDRNQLERKQSFKTTKHRSRRPKVAIAKLEHPKGPGEVAISVADDWELDALQGQDDHGGLQQGEDGHLQGCGVHEHRPHSDVAVGANAHNLHHWRLTRHHHQSQVHLGAEGLEVSELVAERLPLLGLDLCQSDKGVDNQENMECSYLLSMKMRTV